MQKLSSKQRYNLIRIIISLAIFVLLLVLGVQVIYLWLIPYLIVGYDVIRKCWHGITHKQVFDESFLMTLATIGAFGCAEYEEAVAVMLFYQVGEFFQSYAVGKSRKSISELMSIAPEYANIEQKGGGYNTVDPDEVEIDDILLVKAGEKIPVDGVVLNGNGYINTSSLTGESMPQFVSEGDSVISGCINGENNIRIRATKTYENSTVSLILELVENAANKKSKTEAFITRFARYYTPIVVILGALLAVVPSILDGNWGMWILRACTFLVISCPCALVISVPLAFFGGIGAASRQGILVKGSNYLEMMANLGTLVTDKTGTLTEGKFKVTAVEAAPGFKAKDVIKYAAAIESGSTHPIAKSIVEECDKPFEIWSITDIETVPGRGVKGVVGFANILVGNHKLLNSENIIIPEISITNSDTIVYVAKNGKYIGCIEVADSIKDGARNSIDAIINENVENIIMLTGDSQESASKVAAELGITDYRCQLLPQDKVQAVEDLIKSSENNKKFLAFIGDGINDAPVLARADIGIAMGSLGSDAAIEAADIVLMDDKLEKIPALIRIAHKTLAISKTNIVFALTVKIACLLLGAIGIANMWMAVFADVGVAMICIINSMRMLIKEK